MLRVGFNGSFADGSGYFYSSSAVHNASNTTSYEQAVTHIWPILIVQKGGPYGSNGIEVASMSCLKANATTKGSKTIGGVPSIATSIQRYEWVMMGITCLIGVLL